MGMITLVTREKRAMMMAKPIARGMIRLKMGSITSAGSPASGGGGGGVSIGGLSSEEVDEGVGGDDMGKGGSTGREVFAP